MRMYGVCKVRRSRISVCRMRASTSCAGDSERAPRSRRVWFYGMFLAKVCARFVCLTHFQPSKAFSLLAWCVFGLQKYFHCLPECVLGFQKHFRCLPGAFSAFKSIFVVCPSAFLAFKSIFIACPVRFRPSKVFSLLARVRFGLSKVFSRLAWRVLDILKHFSRLVTTCTSGGRHNRIQSGTCYCRTSQVAVK